MTDIPPLSIAARGGPAIAPGGRADPSDFATFLTMLTAQMKHQDPLNPVESTDFATQLATFSGVEQAVRTNELLERMGSSGALGDPSGWLGRQAPIAGPVEVDGTALTLRLPAAIDAEIVVRDGGGATLAREGAPQGGGSVDWVPMAGGAPLPAGRYTLTLEGTSSDGAAFARPVEVFRTVAEVEAAPTGAVVVAADGTRRPAAEIEALRAP
ncbi:flagellar basal-body rod modification protein FlgD [Hasllibacter halocynthiae]|uniref:Basal-body rod modification protein FlgD n=1 Tax=Hasllibacter halocynthiae TaxID=595589 RepID=A0A2T0X2Y4_9RHOB|nr:flagellar hook capping FlgD N-terminal domain-containing protein [Hasllibacter halocynthiae]PRY93224.1 flagellar basal-body rod modification protein FlgD [Hasllibacter halocynthiae]